MSKPFYYFVSVGLLLLVLLNFQTIMQEEALTTLEHTVDNPAEMPGKPFLGLCPFLKDIHVAGYYTDLIYQDNRPSIQDYIFEQAKAALVPTILDRFHPGTHEYVVMYLNNPGSFAQVLTWSDATVVKRLGNNIILLKRLKK